MPPATDSERPTDTAEPTRGRGDACTGWANGGCEGGPSCPPRCPRFFDRTGSGLLVVPFDEAHRPSLVAMYDSIRSQTSGLPPRGQEAIERWLADLTTNGWNLVALDGDAVVGHVGVVPVGSATPEFVIFVRDDYHGRGIGTELLAQTVAHAADGGYEALTLVVERWNHRAIHVYTNLGFEPVGDSSMDLEMRLGLDDPIAETVRRPPAERPGEGRHGPGR